MNEDNFWDVAAYSILEIKRRFRDAYGCQFRGALPEGGHAVVFENASPHSRPCVFLFVCNKHSL
jgi:hypothetical protein